MSNGCPVNSCRSASPNRTLTPGWEGNSSNISQYTAFNDHRLVSHVQLLAILCTQTQISTSKCGCVFLVCVVWRRRNAGAGAPFPTSSLTDERHDTIAEGQQSATISGKREICSYYWCCLKNLRAKDKPEKTREMMPRPWENDI